MVQTFPISISMDKETLDRLDQLARDRRGNRSKTIRELINQATDNGRTDNAANAGES